jgi:hypothetical protein
MIIFKEISKFYIKPFQITKKLLFENELNWIYPVLIYLISFIITFLIVLFNKQLNNKLDAKLIIYYFPYFTLPYILVFSLTGALIFKEFLRNYLTHVYYSILIVSYGFTIFVLFMQIDISLARIGIRISNFLTGLMLILTILITRICFNFMIYRKCKKNWIKSCMEFILNALFILLLYVGFNLLLNTP